jgi:MarR family transcriptional regulator for hemolysin
MADAGGSLSLWQVLLLVRTKQWATQSEMAEAMGITAATLTHHLRAAEAQGLVRRWREPGDRRAQLVELTGAGVAMFDRLRRVAGEHDERLRSQLTDRQVDELVTLLEAVRRSLEPPSR